MAVASNYAAFANKLGAQLPPNASYPVQPVTGEIRSAPKEPDMSAMPLDSAVSGVSEVSAPPAPPPGAPAPAHFTGVAEPTPPPAPPAPAASESAQPTEAQITSGQAAPPPQFAPLQYHPSGWDEGRIPIRPGTIRAMEEVMKAEGAAEKASLYAESIGYMKQAELDKAEAERAAYEHMDLRQRREGVELQAANQLKKVETLRAELKETTVDPHRYFDSKDTFSKIMLVIGAAVGGVSQSLGGGPNPTLSMLDKAIERDIAAQKQAYEQKKDAAGEEVNMYGQLMQRLQSPELSQATLRSLMWESSKHQIEATSNATKSLVAQRRAEGLDAKVAERLVGLQVDLEKTAFVAAHTSGGGPRIDGKKAEAQNSLFVPTGPNGEGYYAKDADAAKKGRALEFATETFKNTIDQGVAARNKTGWVERAAGNTTELLESNDLATAKSASNQAVFAVKSAEDLGALDEGSTNAAKATVGDMGSTFGNPETKAQAYYQNLQKKRDAFRRSQAGQGAQQVVVQNQNGQFVTQTVGQPTAASPPRQSSKFKPMGGK
jgi:hypothetical protein